MSYLQIFVEFFKTGLFAVGGGLATIPFLRIIIDKYGLMPNGLTDMFAIAQSLPGALGVNFSVYAGYAARGVPGAVLAGISLVFPSVAVVAIIARFMEKFRGSRFSESAFYGMRAASAGMLSAAFAGVIAELMFDFAAFAFNVKNCVMFTAFLVLIIVTQKKKIHPILFIIAGAIVGAIVN
jgi:chromate transporter